MIIGFVKVERNIAEKGYWFNPIVEITQILMLEFE
jgi:hypothetical protein